MIQAYCYDGHSDGEKNGPDLEDDMYCLVKHLPQLSSLHGLPAGQWGLPSSHREGWASAAGPEGSEESESSSSLVYPTGNAYP